MRPSNSRCARRYTLSALIVAIAASVSPPLHADTEVIVDHFLMDLQRSLITVRNAIDRDQLPTLSKVTLNLKTTLTTDATGQMTLGVISVGANIAKQSAMEISLELKPPKPSDRAPVSSSEDQLADAIIQSLMAVQRAAKRTPPLHLSKLTATVRFVVEFDTGGGIVFTILGLGLEAGAVIETNRIQELIVEFNGT